jgi:NADH-quinone oxidoreductase subunit F
MAAPSIDQETIDRKLVEQWVDQPAPLLGVLHAFHDRDGYISESAVREIAKALRQPMADLFGTLTFYHHFSQEPGGLDRPRVCTGPVCSLHGADACLSALKDRGAVPMPCAGRCDEPVPVLIGHQQYVGDAQGNLTRKPTPLPPPNPENREECVFAQIREPERNTLSGYRRTGGYQGLIRAVREMTPEGVIEHIKASKLAGRGGAAFPTGLKWEAVAKASGTPKTIVCNADEGEPGCFKDRAILDYDPFAVIEGMTLAAYATGATRGFIYLRYEYPETAALLEKAIADAYAAKLLGQNILDTGFSFELYLRRGGGAYICGEEGSLLNSLEGKHPFPRNRPPFPVTHGFENLPTVVNNVETLAAASHVMCHEPDWYINLGLNGQAGTKIVSISGDVQRPGNYEVPFGLSLHTLLYEWAGGPSRGRTIQAVTMAGLSGGFLSAEDIESATVDEPSIRSKGSMLGAAGMIVYDDSRNMVAAAHTAMAFFAHESCGKCFPCRLGTRRLVERLNGDGPKEMNVWLQEVEDLGAAMKAVSACGLGMAAPLIVESLVKHFPAQVREHVEER